MLTEDEIRNRLGYHKPVAQEPNEEPPSPDTALMHRELRIVFMELLRTLDILLPEGRPKSICFTELETMAMWAHKAVAQLDAVSNE